MTKRRMTKRVAVLLTAVLLIVLVAVLWAPWAAPDEPEQYILSPGTLIKARDLFRQQYADLPGVNTISVNAVSMEIDITVYTDEEADYLLKVVPKTFMGHPVRVWPPSAAPDQPEPYTGRPRTLINAYHFFKKAYIHLPGVDSTPINFQMNELTITAHTKEDAEWLLVVMPKTFMGHPVRVLYVAEWWISSSQVQDHRYPALSPSTVGDPRYDLIRPLVGGIATTAGQSLGSGSTPGDGQPVLFLDGSGSGTLGLITYDNKILTCGHVIAVNLQQEIHLPIGTHVYQPTTEYSNRVGRLAGNLLNLSGITYADAAVATVNSGIATSRGEVFSEEGNYTIYGWTSLRTGDVVRKSGLTTGITRATVVDTYNDWVSYTDYLSVYLASHVLVRLQNDTFAWYGDSGSVVDYDGKFAGLVVGGQRLRDPATGDIIMSIGVISTASYIIAGLGIDLGPEHLRPGPGAPPPIYMFAQPPFQEAM